jgi:hypothetical protein
LNNVIEIVFTQMTKLNLLAARMGAATFSQSAASMVVNFIGTSGDLSRASRRNVSSSAVGSPTLRATMLNVSPLYRCY